MWDLGRPEHALFRAKNVRPDMLELRQEVLKMSSCPHLFLSHSFHRSGSDSENLNKKHQVWVSDIAWLCPNTVGVCSRHGEIRRCLQVHCDVFGSLDFLILRYDVREGGAQRRPVAELVWVEESKV